MSVNEIYSDEVRDARSTYYKTKGIAADGGATEKIGLADFGSLTVSVLNFPERVRTLQRHDLHHILLDGSTSMTGEARVGAFECGSGLGFYVISWFLEPQTIVYGLFLDLRGTYQAFKLGRRSRRLFSGAFRDEWLNMTVGDLRKTFCNTRKSSALIDPILFAAFIVIGLFELVVSFITLPFTGIFYLLKRAGDE